MNNPLFYAVDRQSHAENVRDRIQVSLAIADAIALKSLLAECTPPIAPVDHIGAVVSEVGIPINPQQSADAVVQFEAIRCILAPSSPLPKASPSKRSGSWFDQQESKDLARMVQHESGLHTLGEHLPLALAIARLSNAGFLPEQINDILRLPHYAWYKSWWYKLDANGQFTLPFQRCIRAFHYPDGTLTLQYKDFFEREQPDCFTSLPQKVLIVIRAEQRGFAATLRDVNQQRAALQISTAILICDRLSDLEAQAFVQQGISLYPSCDEVLPHPANCEQCGRAECPMNHRLDSPVLTCRNFLLDSELI